MTIVEACVDTRPKYLPEQVTRIVEHVRVNAIVESETVYNDVYLFCFEVIADQAGDYSGNASVGRWIFRMRGSGAQRCPGGISDKCRVAPAGWNRRHWPPKTVGELRIPAP